MSRPLEATFGRASGIAALLLQFRAAASGTQIRAECADAGHAGRFDRKAADVTAGLLFGNRPSDMVRNRTPCSSIVPSFILRRERDPSGCLTTFDGGSTDKNGHVKLEGVVDNQADKNVAGIRANGVGGVFSVENNLQVAK